MSLAREVPTGPAALTRGRAVRAFATIVAVGFFWYGVTGVLLALERSASTRRLALVVAVASVIGGLALTRATRRQHTAGAAARAVLAGALLWTGVSTAFYSGWVVGPAPAAHTSAALADAARAPSFARAFDALAATAYSSLLAAALLALAVWMARGVPATDRGTTAENGVGMTARFAPFTFIALWAAHELAKLNVFAGVASPGAAYLPPYLAHLHRFFGPAHNSPLLAWSVLALAVAALLCGVHSRASVRDPARRTGFALLAGILLLAAFEHLMLGARTPLDWWKPFLAWRGSL